MTNDDILDEYLSSQTEYQAAKNRYMDAREKVLGLFPKQVGAHEIEVGVSTLRVTYPAKVKWDAEQLDALYGSDKPAYVKLAYSIDMRQLKRLPQDEQDQLAKCYQTAVGSPEIELVS